jgi:hypothetical protein
MRTVKWLREELAKYPDDAVCFAYEGEVVGIVIEYPDSRLVSQGVIYCSEGEDLKESELLPTPEGER